MSTWMRDSSRFTELDASPRTSPISLSSPLPNQLSAANAMSAAGNQSCSRLVKTELIAPLETRPAITSKTQVARRGLWRFPLVRKTLFKRVPGQKQAYSSVFPPGQYG